MLLFLGIGILFLILIWIVTLRMRLISKIPLLLIIAIVIYFFLYYFSDSARGGVEWFEDAPWKHLILFSSMILGMATNYLYDYLLARIKAKEAKHAGNENVKFPQFIWEKLVVPFVVSLLLFGYIWEKHAQSAMNFIAISSSYQNGFFWQTIFEKMGGGFFKTDKPML